MRVAIIGTAGLPAKYGGFETLVEYLTNEIGQKINFTVFCSSKMNLKKKHKHNNSRLRYLPLNANGIQSIPYDIWSLFSAAKSNDVILILGVSGCVILPLFKRLYPNKKLLINIDGLEHMRAKWKFPIKKFLKLSEKIAISYGDKIIADNKEIQSYIKSEYSKDSYFIAYGGDHVKNVALSHSVKYLYKLPVKYAFKVCRIEPENNIDMILEAFSLLDYSLVVVGNWNKSKYGVDLKNKYSKVSSIKLLDAIYDQNVLNQMRSNCSIYIHGHSAGGTNPSLVEAMNLSLPILAFDISYNRSTTFNQALFFKNTNDIINLINNIDKIDLLKLGRSMKKIANNNYTWRFISQEYEKLFV